MKSIDYQTLVTQKAMVGDHITYLEKLNTIEWKQKREIILERDGRCCTNCKVESSTFINGSAWRDMTAEEKADYDLQFYSELEKYFDLYNIPKKLRMRVKPAEPMKEVADPIFLHVHHLYYINNKLPWEYDNKALITLCHNCHQLVHDVTDIPVYQTEKKDVELQLTKCNRCSGSGYLPKFHYYHDGICFGCDGNKYNEFIE